MQIAKGIVVAHVHNQQHVTGVTPAELLIYHAMHFKESNGSPLKEFVIMPGEAETVEIEAISAKPGYLMAGERGMIPGAVAIPLGQLRRRLGELPRDRMIVSYCAVGMRGYLAERILRANGFKAGNLSGGIAMWKAFHHSSGEV